MVSGIQTKHIPAPPDHLNKKIFERFLYGKILKICTGANLPLNYPADAFYLCKKVFIFPNYDFDTVEVAICIAIWKIARELKHKVNMQHIMERSGLNYLKFQALMPQVSRNFPCLQKNRRISKRITEYCAGLGLDDKVIEHAKQVLGTHGSIMWKTTVKIAAASCISLALRSESGIQNIQDVARISDVSMHSIRSRIARIA